MREIVVYGENVNVSEENYRVIQTVSKEYGIHEEVLATFWGYISQAMLDCKEANDRAFRNVERRAAAKRVCKEYGYILTRCSNRLDEVVEILPELGCRAATPENLEYELKTMEIW